MTTRSCSHCRALRPTWAALTAALHDTGISIGEVDCEKEREACGPVDRFPTIVWYQRGAAGNTTFEGQATPTKDELMVFVQGRSGLPVAANVPLSCWLTTNMLQVFLTAVKQLLQLARAVASWVLSKDTSPLDPLVIALALCSIVVLWLFGALACFGLLIVLDKTSDSSAATPAQKPKKE